MAAVMEEMRLRLLVMAVMVSAMVSSCAIVGVEAGITTIPVESVSRSQNVRVGTPSTYDANREEGYPLLMILHGLGLAGGITARRYKVAEISDDLDLMYVSPDAFFTSTSSLTGFRPVPAWCATEQCCCGVRCSLLVPWGQDNVCNDQYNRDSLFLRNVIETVVEQFNVDPERIYVAGQSNGGWMAYRMACDHSDLIAGIMPVCGAPYSGDLKERCPQAKPVHVLHVHGELDYLVDFAGNALEKIDSAAENVKRWARDINNCASETESTSPYVSNNPHRGYGSLLEQNVEPLRYTGCAAETEFWTVKRVGHCPYTSFFNLRWLLDKRKVHAPIPI